MKIAIVAAQYNKEITDRLLKGALDALKKNNFRPEEYQIFEVPGAFEIPFTIQKLINDMAKLSYLKEFDGFIALGCVLKGETDHYKAVCEGLTYGLQKISIENCMPVMFGVLMCSTQEQAISRSQDNPEHNKGYECAEGLIKILKTSNNVL